MFNCAAGREEHCKQMSLVCVGSARNVWVTLGLPLLTACVLSPSTLLRLQVALPGNFLGHALSCMDFPDLRHSGSGSWVLHKAQAQLGLRFVPMFCALPRSEQLRRPGAWQVHSSQVGGGGASYHLPGSSCSVSWLCSGSTVSGVPCVSSGELISG